MDCWVSFLLLRSLSGEERPSAPAGYHLPGTGSIAKASSFRVRGEASPPRADQGGRQRHAAPPKGTCRTRLFPSRPAFFIFALWRKGASPGREQGKRRVRKCRLRRSASARRVKGKFLFKVQPPERGAGACCGCGRRDLGGSGASDAGASSVQLFLERTFHKFAHGRRRIGVFVEHPAHGFGDRRGHVQFFRELAGGRGGFHAFGHHAE